MVEVKHTTKTTKTYHPSRTVSFSWKARLKSFRYAWSGLQSLLATEHNARLHLIATVVVFLLAYFLGASRLEWTILLLAIALVWLTEIINTAIEKTMDFISLEKHPQIKLVKDLAAAAVLIAAVAAFLTGTLIFLPKIIHHV